MFLRVCSTCLMRKLLETEKLLVANNFSFSHSVFYFLENCSHFHLIQNYLLQTLSVWTSLKFVVLEMVNSLLNDKISDLYKLKAFADGKIHVTQRLKFVLGRVENIVGKGENAGNQHFLLFTQCFLQGIFLVFIESRDSAVKK